MAYYLGAISLVLFAVDRVVKDGMTAYATVCNRGIAFSLPLPEQTSLILSGLILFWIAVWMIRDACKQDPILLGAMLCLFLGALSNLIDRFTYGCVVDYLFILPHFLWFNIADVAIFVGGSAFVYRSFQKI